MDEREFQEKLEVEQKARERVAIQTVITAKKTRITTTKQKNFQKPCFNKQIVPYLMP